MSTTPHSLGSTYVPAADMPPALFLPRGPGVVEATELSRGPWAHRVMHGGGITGLMGWVVETALDRPDLVCTRLTVDILSGVPVEELEVEAEVRKAGGRTALVDGVIRHGGRMVARATSQWLAGAPPTDLPMDAAVPPIPEVRADPDSHPDFDYPRPGFNADAVDLRIIEGSTEEPGPGRIWIRLDHPLVDGESTTLFQQVATMADLSAAVGWSPAESGAPLINTDVTLQLLRRPRSEWVLFESDMALGPDGVACCRSKLSDPFGPLGWVLQSQVEAPPEITF